MTVREQVELQLAQRLEAQGQAAAARPLQLRRHALEVSLWLEMTRWEQYLAGKDLAVAARLVDLPEERKLLAALDVDGALRFCVTLLDHCLVGKVYDSIVLGFLAVLGINEPSGCFHDACHYTSYLSAFVKIAQLLVVQRAVLAADSSETEFLAEALEEMQDRFMVYESRSPMSWALKLRLYSKKVRESTTSLGFIV
ncbi:hypothetical protein V493_07975 [Pseudogymnoascus sp. VKM F-4281 (FW-2241)]|nr:hypothetical protein V493_07975 [Pseudogymnoascus sp. VKM F-4281 (FW-2241)]